MDTNNVLFRDVNDFKILYRSNGLIPFDMSNKAEQYKNFIYGFFSKQNSYKKFKNQKEESLKKEDNKFFYKLHNINDYDDLLFLIKDELNKEKSEFFARAEKEIKNKKFRRYKTISIAVILLVLIYFFSILGSNGRIQKVAEEYQNKIERLENENQLIKNIATGDTDKAIKTMQNNNESNDKISELLFSMGEYNKAIEFDPSIEPKIVHQLYSLNQKQKVLDLKSNTNFIEQEKMVLTKDTNYLCDQIYLIENKETLERLGLRFLDENLIDFAREVGLIIRNERFADKIKKKQLEIEIEQDLSKISYLRAEKNENNEEEIKKLTKNVSEKQKEIISLEELICDE